MPLKVRRLDEPWGGFLSGLDAQLSGPVDFHCMGGFVVSQFYGFARETADLDVLTLTPRTVGDQVLVLGGKGSHLHQRYGVYVDRVGFANYPMEYESRLLRAFPIWEKVRLWALEAHDLALTKLERSNDRDIRDVMFLAQAGLIQREVLVDRFETELEPFIGGRTPTWNRTTLQMWIDACW